MNSLKQNQSSKRPIHYPILEKFPANSLSCLAAANIEVEAQTLLEDDVEEVDVEEQESDEEVEGNLAEPVIDVLGDHSVGEVEFTTE